METNFDHKSPSSWSHTMITQSRIRHCMKKYWLTQFGGGGLACHVLTVFTMAKNQLQLAQIIFHRKEIVDVTMLLSWLIP